MNILQEIFNDYYEEMIYTLHPRKSVIENVDKMLHCGDPAFGGAMYGCPHCGKLKFVPFRCHSRFCPTCGNKYSMERTTNMSFKLINVQHRHCVFTIDENLRDFFLQDRSLLNCLFHAVTSVVLHVKISWKEVIFIVSNFFCYMIQCSKRRIVKMQTNIEELRKKYINNPPEGLTSKDIRSMSDEKLLDMDYFMNEELDDDFGEEGFYIF